MVEEIIDQFPYRLLNNFFWQLRRRQAFNQLDWSFQSLNEFRMSFDESNAYPTANMIGTPDIENTCFFVTPIHKEWGEYK